MLGQDGAVAAGNLGAAQDRAEVLRIHDRVERHPQVRNRGEQILQRPFTPGLQLSRDALVHTRRHGIETLWRDHLDPGQAGQLLEPRVMTKARSLEDLHHAPRTRGLEHGVAPMDEGGRRALFPRGPTLALTNRSHPASIWMRRQRTPSLESSRAIPRRRSSSRMWSPRAKSRAFRATARSA